MNLGAKIALFAAGGAWFDMANGRLAAATRGVMKLMIVTGA